MSKQLPRFDVYCRNTTGQNALVFSIGDVDVYYSYRTPVAFRAPGMNGGRTIVRENDWGPTTGKHLNAIDGGSREARKLRVSSAEFEARLRHVIGSEEVQS